MIEMVNDVVLLPYTLFNYMFNTINWEYENNHSDWFQYRFNRFMDNCHDFFLKFKFWGKK